jgi:ABC-type polysaccharide/polyol phosphate transport system ATPase subunit
MKARLGFSIATHLEPDIMILDEVLGVGDGAFWAKCMDRLRLHHRNGATILSVSHSPAAIRSMCDRALWLDRGEMKGYGETDATVSAYQRFLDGRGALTASRLNVGRSSPPNLN